MDAARYIIDRVLGKSVQPIAAEVTAPEERLLTLDECFELTEAILVEERERRDKGAQKASRTGCRSMKRLKKTVPVTDQEYTFIVVCLGSKKD